MKRWTLALGALLAVSLPAAACGGKKEAAPQADAATQQPGTSPPTDGPQPTPAPAVDAATTPPAEQVAPDAAAAPTPNEPPSPTAEAPTGPVVHDRATMHKAYIEIYCAQRKGEATALLDLYSRYGFTDPEAWTRAWTEHAKDAAWVAQVTSEAISACP